MDIIKYDKLNQKEIILFLENAHKLINKKMEYEIKDSDLINLDTHYGKKNAGLWCIIENKEIIGTIALRPLENSGTKYMELRRLYIAPKWQNKGLGSELIDFAINFSHESGYKKIRATTSIDRVVIIYLLQKKGFYQIPKYRTSSADLFYEISLEHRFSNLYNDLINSMKKSKNYFKRTLILNPVENIPDIEVLEPCSSFLHGLYNTDSIRNEKEKLNTKIQFSGRNEISSDVNKIYNEWAKLLKGEAVSMRLLSGLHAHMVVFMGLANIGDRVLILPESAGGHMATKAILERLGLVVEELVVDYTLRKVNVVDSLKLIKEFSPKVIFIDRSEGLEYEDFSWLRDINAYKIFDASQYLTNIISGDFTNPFQWGFNLILTTLHKNMPGPQRAMICTKTIDENWYKIRSGMSTYVSNMHVFSIYSAGIILNNYESLAALSKNMLINTVALEQELKKANINVIQSSNTIMQTVHTHHVWILAENKEEAFDWYLVLERIGLLVNYRKLPYNLGYGLRLGLSAATNCGLCKKDIPDLAKIIAKAIRSGYSDSLKSECDSFISRVKRINYGE
ncbi:GNAT family N-acetyltransferase [Blautia schinkii]|nr:GNAT family N-acetyltransferase [Blautia schinkii]